MPKKKLIVIGGGAAGFFCAVNAARMNDDLEVVILEKSNKLLSKVKISGGGRCNVTHACFDKEEMSRNYPRGLNFVRKTFYQFFTTDTIQWFEDRGVKLKAEPDGRMFPITNSSQTIINCLLNEAGMYHVNVLLNTSVERIDQRDAQFDIQLTGKAPITADFICIACGGYPKLAMFDWLKNTGHIAEAPVPSLFTFNMPNHPIQKLTGVSVERVRIKIAGSKLEQEGPLLITHWGFSGPAILKLSAWAARELADKDYTFTIQLNWLPAYNEQQLSEKIQSMRLTAAGQQVNTKNSFNLPQRLWEYFTNESGIAVETRWSELRSKDANKLAKLLCNGEFAIKGKTTFKEEFVTAGGMKLNEVDHNTMMSKKVLNLFFAGEILNVDGVTGGFNFQHAWTSGWIAAKSIAAANH